MVGMKLFEPRLVERCQRHSMLLEPLAEFATSAYLALTVCEA